MDQELAKGPWLSGDEGLRSGASSRGAKVKAPEEKVIGENSPNSKAPQTNPKKSEGSFIEL